MTIKSLVAALVVPVLAGCTSIPDVEFRYYPARAITSVTVTQTVDCSPDKTRFHIVQSSPSVLTVYSSDRSKEALVLSTKELKGTFADADIKFEWYEDGRLKSVNQSAVGQGENITKAAMAFLAPVLGAGPAPQPSDCDKLSALGGEKPLVIVYEGTIEYVKGDGIVTYELAPNSNSAENSAAVKGMLKDRHPKMEFRVNKWEITVPVVQPPAGASSTADSVPLKLRGIAIAPVELLVDRVPFWNGRVVVPTAETYTVPIPKPKLFGKQSFGLSLSEAGAITVLIYGNLSGTAGTINALNSLSTTLASSDATKASAIKAEADVIAQTQRLAACQAKPSECK